MSIQTVEISLPESIIKVIEIRQGPAGPGGGGNNITSATTSDGTADLDLLNVETITATVSGTLTADHIHGNLAGSVYAHIRAGEALAKGDPVYVSGSHGSGSSLIPIVSKADASNAAKMPAVGIMDAAVANNTNGHMVIVGTITKLDTAGLTVNAELYVAAGGGMTATPPTARAQPVARVERVNANNGAVIVKVNGLSASDATANTLVRRTSDGSAVFFELYSSAAFIGDLNVSGGIQADGPIIAEAAVTFQGTSSISFNSTTYTYGTGAASAHRIALGAGTTGAELFGAATAAAANTILANNIVAKNANFTLAQTDAGTYMRLTKTGSTQTITLPVSGISAGAEFQFYRITTQSLAFSGGTVNGTANLASVPTNGAFALKHISSGTYDFI
jgi:hypothetical protein